MTSLTPAQAVEHVWQEQQARYTRLVAELPPGSLSSRATRESETVLLTLTRLAKLAGLQVSLPAAVDARPVAYCPACEQNVVSLPSGACPWCETRLDEPAA